MKTRTPRYPLLRREFGTAAEMAALIDRSPGYIYSRMSGEGDFTRREKNLILDYLGKPGQSEKYFEEEAENV